MITITTKDINNYIEDIKEAYKYNNFSEIKRIKLLLQSKGVIVNAEAFNTKGFEWEMLKFRESDYYSNRTISNEKVIDLISYNTDNISIYCSISYICGGILKNAGFDFNKINNLYRECLIYNDEQLDCCIIDYILKMDNLSVEKKIIIENVCKFENDNGIYRVIFDAGSCDYYYKRGILGNFII